MYHNSSTDMRIKHMTCIPHLYNQHHVFHNINLVSQSGG